MGHGRRLPQGHHAGLSLGAGAALRLYLSSFRLGDRAERLPALAAGRLRALVIANACDIFPESERAPRVEREIRALAGLGFEPEELDLRGYFGSPRGGLESRLAGAGLIWARGGNAFILGRAMRQSGFDALLRDALGRDALVYGGYSGGIAVLSPSLEGIEIVNDPAALPPGYDPALIPAGLGILPYHLAPHYKSAHPSSPGIDRLVEYYIDHKIPFKALRDGEAIVRDGGREEILTRR